MLSPFDWLRLSRTGAELLATLQHLAEDPELASVPEALGPPPSALSGPCQRCWVYPPPVEEHSARYCPTCHDILTRARRLGYISRHAIVIWGWVSQLPRQLHTGLGFQDSHILGTYLHDETHFLLMLCRQELKSLLRELVLYHGAELKGLIQIFPTVGFGKPNMGEFLCRIVHHEGRFPMDRLRVRFLSRRHQIFRLHAYDKQGVLTFEITEFLSMLETAAVFRTILRPGEQKMLYELLHMEDRGEAQFYWGRLLGYLSQEARDMLDAWGIRRWPEAQINLLYRLVGYVTFYQPH